MKKVIVAGLIAMAPIVAQAGNSAGCGLGSQLFDGQSGLAPNILAATTNGLSGNNTFGMTSGTLGCNDGDTVMAAADAYLDSNMERVARDMASGEGEALETLAALIGIDDADKAVFYTVSKSNFSKIYGRSDVTSQEVLVSLKAVMLSNDTLAKYVA